MFPFAPMSFSITTWPQDSLIFCAIRRPNTSGEPPGEVPTMILTAFTGYWAAAGTGASAATARARRRRMPSMLDRSETRVTLQHGHHLVVEQCDRAQRLLQAEVAESELPDEIVRARFGELLLHVFGRALGRAGERAPVLGDRVEFPRARVPVTDPQERGKIGEALVPATVRPARKRASLACVLSDDDKPPEPHPRQGRLAARVSPDRAKPLEAGPELCDRVEADHVHAAPRGALGGLRRMHAVPQRRMRFLQRGNGERQAPLSALRRDRDRTFAQAFEDEPDHFLVHLLRLRRIDVEETHLGGQRAAAESDVQPSAAHLVEHADLLEQPQA